jgi:hypothetical protein
LTDFRFWAVWIPLYYGTIFAAEHPVGIGLSVLLVIWCLVGVHAKTGRAASVRGFDSEIADAARRPKAPLLLRSTGRTTRLDR